MLGVGGKGEIILNFLLFLLLFFIANIAGDFRKGVFQSVSSRRKHLFHITDHLANLLVDVQQQAL